MKIFLVLLTALSVTLSAVLVTLLVKGESTPEAAATVAVERTAPESQAATEPGVAPGTWAALQSPEATVLTDRLRAAGFPADVVRAVISAQISEQMSARRKALMPPNSDSLPFWKTPVQDAKALQASRDLTREQQKLLRNALGADADANDPLTLARMRQRFGDLPPDKMQQVQALTRSIDEKRMEMYAGGVTLDREKQRALELEQETALQAILTPAEYTDYQLRTSNTASQMRYDLVGFNPTEQEFRALFELRKPVDEQYSMNTPTIPSQETMRLRTEAMAKINEAFKATLSPERAALYDRAQDNDYRRGSQLVARLELPAETNDRLYDVRKSFEPRVNAIRMDRQMPAAQRNEALAALQQEAVAAVTPLLGNARYIDTYRQYGGNWITSMVPRVAAPPPGAARGGPAAPTAPRP